MSLPHTLTSLSPREAITDALYRAVIGLDSNDASLFESAFVPSVTLDLNGHVMTGLPAIKTQLLDFIGPMNTTHMISNIRIEVQDGASTASLTAYALAQHCLPGEGVQPDGKKFLAGSTYAADLVRDSAGAWKFEKLVLKFVWTQGDASVMQRPS